MSTIDERTKRISEYDKLKLFYTVQDHPGHEEENKKNYELIKKCMDDVGINFNLYDDGVLVISVFGFGYELEKTRRAGRKRKYTLYNGDFCKYSDIILMSQTMNDKRIADKIGMKTATYYRHKRDMRDSEYYKNLDQNRLSDRDYLESLPGNYDF